MGIVWKAYYKGVPAIGSFLGITPEASGVDGEKKQTSYVFKTKVSKNISTSEPYRKTHTQDPLVVSLIELSSCLVKLSECLRTFGQSFEFASGRVHGITRYINYTSVNILLIIK